MWIKTEIKRKIFFPVEKVLDKSNSTWYHNQAVWTAIYGRVVELVDSLDSGSSVHCGRAGSSPASPTKKTLSKDRVFL